MSVESGHCTQEAVTSSHTTCLQFLLLLLGPSKLNTWGLGPAAQVSQPNHLTDSSRSEQMHTCYNYDAGLWFYGQQFWGQSVLGVSTND